MSRSGWRTAARPTARFNGAATLPSRMSSRAKSSSSCHESQLQWGRDVTVADVYMPCGRREDRLRASMGPRRYRRGCRAASHPKRTTPRPGFNGAATLPSRMSRRNVQKAIKLFLLLQWGRDVTVADVFVYHRCTPNAKGGFNGAATLPSRMSGRKAPTSHARAELQWGRDVTVADVYPGCTFA